MSLTLAEVVTTLDRTFDPSWAEDWDAVGLVTGDPAQVVERVLFAVDPAAIVVAEAVEWGADLVVCHHPLLLRGVHGVAATTPKGRIVHELLGSGTALFTAHTNADVPVGGVNEALARAVGITEPRLIPGLSEGSAGEGPALDKLVCFVPREHADAVRTAVTAAGAGAVGDYDSATFSSDGEGRFRPLTGATPAVGTVGELSVVAESRIEAVLPRGLRDQVVSAMRAAHPYEEVAFDVVELAPVPRPSATRGHGRIGELAEPTTLRGFAEQVGHALPATAHGVRVGGDPERPVRTVVVGAGAGDFMLDVVRDTGADVFVTSDLRHHRAAEFLEQAGPALVDVAHWAAEWTWLPVVERTLHDALSERGARLSTRVSRLVTDPWTFRVDR